MKVHDLSEWHAQGVAFANDPSPLALRFQKFIETWAELAEALPDKSPIEALRATLGVAEECTETFSIGFIGQALLLLCTHWAPILDRDLFFSTLTPIEAHLFNDAVAVWKAQQAALAQRVES